VTLRDHCPQGEGVVRLGVLVRRDRGTSSLAGVGLSVLTILLAPPALANDGEGEGDFQPISTSAQSWDSGPADSEADSDTDLQTGVVDEQGTRVRGAGDEDEGIDRAAEQGAGVRGAGDDDEGIDRAAEQGAGAWGAGNDDEGIDPAAEQGAGAWGAGDDDEGIDRAPEQGTGVRGAALGEGDSGAGSFSASDDEGAGNDDSDARHEADRSAGQANKTDAEASAPVAAPVIDLRNMASATSLASNEAAGTDSGGASASEPGGSSDDTLQNASSQTVAANDGAASAVVAGVVVAPRSTGGEEIAAAAAAGTPEASLPSVVQGNTAIDESAASDTCIPAAQIMPSSLPVACGHGVRGAGSSSAAARNRSRSSAPGKAADVAGPEFPEGAPLTPPIQSGGIFGRLLAPENPVPGGRAVAAFAMILTSIGLLLLTAWLMLRESIRRPGGSR